MYNIMAIKGEYNKAIDYIDDCLDIIGTGTTSQQRYLSNKASILLMAFQKTNDKKYIQMAIELYGSLLDDMPMNPMVLNNIAYWMIYMDTDVEKAAEYAKKAAEMQPENPNILDTYGYALCKIGESQVYYHQKKWVTRSSFTGVQ